MTSEIVRVPNQADRSAISTIDLASMEGKVKALQIVGGGGEAGKDWLPNKRVVLEVDQVVLTWSDETEKSDGEVIRAGWRAVLVLRDGTIVRFSSYRVVGFFRAALDLWGHGWAGLKVAITKSTVGGKTNYVVEYEGEGDWRD